MLLDYLQHNKMLEDDFPPDDVASLKQELEMYKGKCHYDSEKKKVVYNSAQDAMNAYMRYQAQKMEDHKWIESEKAHHDLGQEALLDWDRKFAPDFHRFWRMTHEFVPVKRKIRLSSLASSFSQRIKNYFSHKRCNFLNKTG